MRALALLGMVACTSEGPTSDANEPPDRAGLQVRLVVEASDEPEEEDEVWLDRLAVHVDEVVLEADGPDGPVSISTFAGVRVSLIGAATGDDTIVLDLPAGRYENAFLDVSLRESADMPALEARGLVEERPMTLEVRPGLVLGSERGWVVLGEGPDPVVLLRLHPAEWFDEVEWEDEEDLLPLDIRPGSEDYEAVVSRIVATTETEFPGG